MDSAPQPAVSRETTMHYKEVNTLCQKTDSMLQNFKINDKPSAKKLLKIIELTNSLKDAQIPEKQIGFFWFAQHYNYQQPLSTLVGESIKKTLHMGNTISPFYTAVFFERLSIYNQRLVRDQHVSPNITQLKNHWNAKKLSLVASNSSQFGITIAINTLTEKTIPIPPAVGAKTFDQFILDISKTLLETPQNIKTLAKLIYHNELKTIRAPLQFSNPHNSTENS